MCGWHGLACDRCFLCASSLGSQDIQEALVVTGLVESWRIVFFLLLNFKILRRDFLMWMVMKGGIRAEQFTVLEGKWFIPSFLNCNTDVLYLKTNVFWYSYTQESVYFFSAHLHEL